MGGFMRLFCGHKPNVSILTLKGYVRILLWVKGRSKPAGSLKSFQTLETG